MKEVDIRFFGDLEELLEPGARKRTLHTSFYGPRSVKDLVESFSVPHTEVAFIKVNGELVDFPHPLQDKDRVDVYPLSYEREFAAAEPLVPRELDRAAFVCDVHLGKLARYLRLLGFDTAFDKGRDDPQLAVQSREELRILLTRDRKLLMRNLVWSGLLIRSQDSVAQAAQVIRRFKLEGRVHPFSRCSGCNHLLRPICKADDDFVAIEDNIPARVRDRHHQFAYCEECGAVYWQGTHADRLMETFKNILK
jgi:uncharacterized protein with PIN domain